MTSYVFPLIAFAFLLASGQMLLKAAALKLNEPSADGLILSLLKNHWLMLGVVLYGVSTLLWVWIVRSTPLNLAYPFVALGFVIVPIGSYFFFKETVSLGYYPGALLIIAGVMTIVMTANNA